MPPALRAAYLDALRSAQRAEHSDPSAAFAALERAHILSQRFLLAHLATHLRMLRIAWRRRDRREILGQSLRAFATLPGYATGWIPKGNTGGADVPALRPMPLPPELQPLLRDFSVWRDVALRMMLYAVLIAAFCIVR